MDFTKKELYFQNDDVTLLYGDCFKLLKKINSKSIDVIFADPPYFLSTGGVSCHSGRQVINNKGKWDAPKTPEDKLVYNREWIRLCKEVLKDNGTIWISGTFHNIYSIGVALELEGFSIINNITWQKPNPAPNLACRCFTNSTETILWARKQLTPKKKGKHYFDYPLMKKQNGGKQQKDLWTINLPSKSEKRFGKHPTQKPEALLDKIILASSKKGDLILDPFNGSGTTGVSAIRLSRKYIGIDNMVKYLRLTKKRLSEVNNGSKKL